MTQDSSSLDQLHGIVEPAPIPVWPPAPGWYAVITIAAITTVWFAWRSSRIWKANAYRRAALRELATLTDAGAIAALLRRTALAIAPRAEIAELHGDRWVEWLVARCEIVTPPDIRDCLSCGIYEPPKADATPSGLHTFASEWIARHSAIPEK